MPAYIIGRILVTDPAQYAKYMQASPAIIAAFGGRFIARGGESLTLEGPAENKRVIILEFPTLDAAKAFYHSEQYQAAKLLRDQAAIAHFFAIDGVP